MAKSYRCNFLSVFVVLLSTSVLVRSLPTSVLVDEKEQQNQQSPSSSSANESHATGVKIIPSSFEQGNPIMTDKSQSKIHAQKRGVKQNFYEPGMPSDVIYANSIPAGWNDPEETIPFAELQDLEDYQQYYQPPFSAPHRQMPYDFQRVMSSDNLYDEPLALPVKHKYPTRFFDERRKRGVNKNIMRLKRDSTKLNTADMYALLSYLEANQPNRYDNANDDINSLEYQKPYAYNSDFDGANNDDDVNGEWLNGYIEPSVQYYGTPHYGRLVESPRKHATSSVFPVKRFMIAKKKRSLNQKHASGKVAANDAQKKSLFGIDLNPRAA